jgi:hypothetical protein
VTPLFVCNLAELRRRPAAVQEAVEECQAGLAYPDEELVGLIRGHAKWIKSVLTTLLGKAQSVAI